MILIPFFDLKAEYKFLRDKIHARIQKCFEHQKWILGLEVRELEEKVSKYLDATYCIAVSSGTEALLLCLRAFAIKKGEEFFERDDEIITPSFTFTATAEAIVRSGATPVFVDVDEESYNISPKKIEEAITEKTVGIVVVHLYGQTCSMDEILKIAKRHNLFVLEDAAQSFGAMYKGKYAGTMADAGAFSYFPTKPLGCYGDGGMIATEDEEIAEITRALRTHGGKDKYNPSYIGYNARLDTIQAAILLAKLPYIDQFNEARRKIASVYNENLSKISYLKVPQQIEGAKHIYNIYTLRMLEGKREALVSYLKERGVPTAVYYPTPLHKMKAFSRNAKIYNHLRTTETLSQQVISLPISPFQSEKDTDYIISQIREFFK